MRLFLHKFQRRKSQEFWFTIFGEWSGDDIQWSINYLLPGKYIIRGDEWPFLVFPGLRGTRPYNPIWVLRQFDIRQVIPETAPMLRFFIEYDKSETPLKKYIVYG